jgi:membrane glycosyltransferase
MDTLNHAAVPEARSQHEQDEFLPAELPMAMSTQALHRYPDRGRAGDFERPSVSLRRAYILLGTAVLTLAGCYEMYDVLKVGGVTILESLVLGLFVLLFAWIAFSFMSTMAGFFVLLLRMRDPLGIDPQSPLPSIRSKTALLLPTYNENPYRIMGRLRAICESVEQTGQASQFEWFVLSDTTDPSIWIAEEKCFLRLRAHRRADRLFYRHRPKNTARKSGNIEDWVRRFGAGYDHMIILDADSLMTGDTIVRLVAAMEQHPTVALIQTLPVVVNARTLFARLQQFAGRLYGPLIAAGIAWWHGSEGNYWGHNAIIRVRAFARDAGLPELRGRKPFGGHILSHDFVEAALMRRGGWEIRMAPTLGGSFEECPPSLLDFAARDRSMVPRQPAASGRPSGAQVALGVAAASVDRDRGISHRAALAALSGARDIDLVAGAICPARVFSERIFAVPHMARAGSCPGCLGFPRHDGIADRAKTARFRLAANATGIPEAVRRRLYCFCRHLDRDSPIGADCAGHDDLSILCYGRNPCRT